MTHVTRIAPLWDTLARIQSTLDLTDVALAEQLHIPFGEFEKLRTSRLQVNHRSAMALAERLNISFEALLEDRLDYVAMAKQYQGNRAYIPEQYLEAAKGRIRVTKTYLGFIESRFGWHKRAAVMKHLQITEAALFDPGAAINFKLNMGIVNWLARQSRDAQNLFDMGGSLVASQLESPLAHELSDSRSITELFEALVDGLLERHWEKNFVYRIWSLTPSGLRLRATPNPELIQVPGMASLLNRPACELRCGIIASIPLFMGRPPGIVRQLKCIADGDPYCEFDLRFASNPSTRTAQH